MIILFYVDILFRFELADGLPIDGAHYYISITYIEDDPINNVVRETECISGLRFAKICRFYFELVCFFFSCSKKSKGRRNSRYKFHSFQTVVEFYMIPSI